MKLLSVVFFHINNFIPWSISSRMSELIHFNLPYFLAYIHSNHLYPTIINIHLYQFIRSIHLYLTAIHIHICVTTIYIHLTFKTFTLSEHSTFLSYTHIEDDGALRKKARWPVVRELLSEQVRVPVQVYVFPGIIHFFMEYPCLEWDGASLVSNNECMAYEIGYTPEWFCGCRFKI